MKVPISSMGRIISSTPVDQHGDPGFEERGIHSLSTPGLLTGLQSAKDAERAVERGHYIDYGHS